MTMHLSHTSLMLRVLSAFFAAVCILASVNAYAEDTVFLYYDDVFKTSGTDVGTVLNSGYQGYTLKITGSATHSEKAVIGTLTIYGFEGKRQINVQSSDPSVPYVFTKNTDSLQLYMTDIDYCGNADQNVRSIFARDQYTGSSSSSMAMTFHNVTISSFNAPDSEVCSVINNSNTDCTITLLGIEDIVTTFSNNRGCIHSKVIDFNSSTTDADAPTGDWRFINNYADNGSAMYFVDTFFKNGGKYTYTGNSAAVNGGAMFCTADYKGTGSVTTLGRCHLNSNELILKFEDNIAGEKGGAIYGYESEILLSGEVTVKNNRAGIGLDGSLLSNNIASGKGGAIHCETSIYTRDSYVGISDTDSTFESNWAYSNGGAIYTEGSAEIRGNTSVKFLKNVAGFGDIDESTYHQGSGGAIYSKWYTHIQTTPAEFTENSAYYGGAIYSENFARIWEASAEFSKNSASSGGAIYTENYFYVRNSSTIFSENSAANSGGAIYNEAFTYLLRSPSEFSANAAHYGGAIYSDVYVNIEDSPVTFSNNKADQGGAIYTRYLQFSGSAASATFTGNYGAFYNSVNDNVCGNDVYLPVNIYYDPDSDVCTNLAFWGGGPYSFDGGIYIERSNYSDDPYYTVINQSQVTIAGRANDSTNYYQLRKAYIFNSGKLTAKLDEIEGVNGIFVMDDNSAKLELNVTGADPKKLTMNIEDASTSAQDNDLAVQGSGVIEKTGDGTLQILAAAEGLVCAESFVVSSGRLDYRGYFTGAVEVGGSEAEAVFSPGNSVGDAYVVDGNVSILNNGVALFEFGEFPGIGSDSNHDVLYITNTNRKFSAGDQKISLFFENSVAEDWSYEDCKYLLVSGAGLPDGDFTSWLDGNYTGLFSLLSEDHNLYLVYPLPVPIPEPSTIALLLLGVAGLMYWRRRKN